MSTVLVVEDDLNSAMLLSNIIRSMQHDCICTRDADDAIAALETHPEVELVLIDLRLPGHMDGWQLAEHLRNHTPTQHLQLVAVSVEAQQNDRQHALEAGCDAYIAKPYSVADLRHFLKSALS